MLADGRLFLRLYPILLLLLNLQFFGSLFFSSFWVQANMQYERLATCGRLFDQYQASKHYAALVRSVGGSGSGSESGDSGVVGVRSGDGVGGRWDEPRPMDWTIRMRPDLYFYAPLPPLATLRTDAVHARMRCFRFFNVSQARCDL